MNWFGGSSEERVETTPAETPAVQRADQLVIEVLNLEAAPHPGGVIVTAKGLAPTQGYFEATLVEVAREGSRVIYDFRAKPPLQPAPEGARVTRELITGLFITRQDLGQARQITVRGQNNQRSVQQR